MDIDQLFHEHHERVFQAAYRVSGNGQDAEDVLQTVFLNLIRRPPREMDNPASYLCRAAINRSLDVLRKRHAQPGDTEVELQTSESASESGLMQDDLRSHLRKALEQINPRGAEIPICF